MTFVTTPAPTVLEPSRILGDLVVVGVGQSRGVVTVGVVIDPARWGIAVLAAYSLALSTVVFSALPVTPADAAPGDGLCYLIADSGGVI